MSYKTSLQPQFGRLCALAKVYLGDDMLAKQAVEQAFCDYRKIWGENEPMLPVELLETMLTLRRALFYRGKQKENRLPLPRPATAEESLMKTLGRQAVDALMLFGPDGLSLEETAQAMDLSTEETQEIYTLALQRLEADGLSLPETVVALRKTMEKYYPAGKEKPPRRKKHYGLVAAVFAALDLAAMIGVVALYQWSGAFLNSPPQTIWTAPAQTPPVPIPKGFRLMEQHRWTNAWQMLLTDRDGRAARVTMQINSQPILGFSLAIPYDPIEISGYAGAACTSSDGETIYWYDGKTCFTLETQLPRQEAYHLAQQVADEQGGKL